MLGDSQAFLANPGVMPEAALSQLPYARLLLVTAAPPMRSFADTKEYIAKFAAAALALPETTLVRSKKDLTDFRAGTTKIVFGLQHAPDDLTTREELEELAALGIKTLALAYENAGPFGSGFLATGGLTERGRELIRMMDEAGIMLDVSHANHQTAREALEFIADEKLSMKPLASHSGVHEAFAHPRNVSAAVLSLIKRLKGYLGLPLIQFFLHPQKSQANFALDFVHHLSLAMLYAGGANVGIGSDVVHRDSTIGEAWEEFSRMQKMLNSSGKFGEYFPDRDQRIIERGSRLYEVLIDILSETTMLETDEMQNVLGMNFLRYLERALPE